MKKLLISVFFLLLLLAPMVRAQEPENPKPPSDTILGDLIKWGEETMPYPDWNVRLDATPGQVSVTWSNNTFALVYYLYQWGDPESFTDFSGSELDTKTDPEWMQTVMENYDKWEETQRCYDDETLTVELVAVHEEKQYKARYWVWAEKGAFHAVTAVFPRDQEADLEALADAHFGEAARCSGG